MKLIKQLNKDTNYTEWQLRRYLCSFAFIAGMAIGAFIRGAL